MIAEKFLDAELNNYFMMTTRVCVNSHKGALTNWKINHIQFVLCTFLINDNQRICSLLWTIWKHNHHIDWKRHMPMDIKPRRCLHFHTCSDAYYYFYNIIVLNLFIILVQLLESSCVRMLWRATKWNLLPHVPRRLITWEAVSILYSLYVIILVTCSIYILPTLSIYLSMIFYSILFYHVRVAHVLPLVYRDSCV
jgi:hypothetical protein